MFTSFPNMFYSLKQVWLYVIHTRVAYRTCDFRSHTIRSRGPMLITLIHLRPEMNSTRIRAGLRTSAVVTACDVRSNILLFVAVPAKMFSVYLLHLIGQVLVYLRIFVLSDAQCVLIPIFIFKDCFVTS